jgi:hypothetical protein
MTTESRKNQGADKPVALGSTDGLGPLPEPLNLSSVPRLIVLGHTPEQMRAYAVQERAAERERIFGHIRSAMEHAEAGYDDVAWRLLASLVGPNARAMRRAREEQR